MTSKSGPLGGVGACPETVCRHVLIAFHMPRLQKYPVTARWKLRPSLQQERSAALFKLFKSQFLTLVAFDAAVPMSTIQEKIYQFLLSNHNSN